MELATELRGEPWPELLPDQWPVLVVPAGPDRPVVPGDGWTGRAPATCPNPGWSAVLAGSRLTIRRPGGQLWFDGPVAATRQWQRRVRDHRALLLVLTWAIGATRLTGAPRAVAIQPGHTALTGIRVARTSSAGLVQSADPAFPTKKSAP
ncbi:hypothetical protein ACFYNO_39860 [Kitasatospora sp. NPDC006697]|uniref:hypothetical protein n=1 Tax=Kitasatospora sp. NPDC006697 TaxID=3364020 RepID=UPI003698B0A3